jgi:hypothetical protein
MLPLVMKRFAISRCIDVFRLLSPDRLTTSWSEGIRVPETEAVSRCAIARMTTLKQVGKAS